MGHKVFISYKYGDTSVQHLSRNKPWEITKVRDYVDELQDLLSEEDHINKGELDGEDLSGFKDSTIESRLRKKIYDSTVTIVLISPNMKESWRSESDQWIPWEISYSLRETHRGNNTSYCNGIIAVVIPDRDGRYDYMLEPRTCCSQGCTTWHTEKLFSILRDNMFNRKDRNEKLQDCNRDETVYSGDVSYINMVKWEDFIKWLNFYISLAETKKDNARDNYDIKVNL